MATFSQLCLWDLQAGTISPSAPIYLTIDSQALLWVKRWRPGHLSLLCTILLLP